MSHPAVDVTLLASRVRQAACVIVICTRKARQIHLNKVFECIRSFWHPEVDQLRMMLAREKDNPGEALKFDFFNWMSFGFMLR